MTSTPSHLPVSARKVADAKQPWFHSDFHEWWCSYVCVQPPWVCEQVCCREDPLHFAYAVRLETYQKTIFRRDRHALLYFKSVLTVCQDHGYRLPRYVG